MANDSVETVEQKGQDQRPLYEVKATSYIGDDLREPGERVHFDGGSGHNLEPLNDAAKAKADEVAQRPKGLSPGDAGFISQLIHKSLTENAPTGAPKAPPSAAPVAARQPTPLTSMPAGPGVTGGASEDEAAEEAALTPDKRGKPKG